MTLTDIIRTTPTTLPTPAHTPTPFQIYTVIPTFSPTSTPTRYRTPFRTWTPTLTPQNTPTGTPTIAPQAMVLPHALYFLKGGTWEDEFGSHPSQIWRLERDGTTLTEITHERVNIIEFDVSLRTGDLAYVTEQFTDFQVTQLKVLLFNNSEPQVIASSSDRLGIDRVESLHWSPYGHILAFHQIGINFYQTEQARVLPVLHDHIVAGWDNSDSIDNWYYLPQGWSPDGQYLSVFERSYEGGSWVLYHLQSGTIIPMNASNSWNEASSWASDSSRVIFSSAAHMGDDCTRLVQFDLATRQNTVAVECQRNLTGYNESRWPLLTSSGDLYYFYSDIPDLEALYSSFQPAPWTMLHARLNTPDSTVSVRSDFPGGISEVLWAENGEMAVVLFNHGSGPLLLLPTDVTQPVQFLRQFGENLRWGP